MTLPASIFGITPVVPKPSRLLFIVIEPRRLRNFGASVDEAARAAQRHADQRLARFRRFEVADGQS